jgi:DNA-binding transcriptional LysR family regulator
MVQSLQSVDLNLLVALKVLLEEEAVTVAAKKYGRSVSAMSRTLSRLRETLNDPILVRAGDRLVATPRAKELLPTVTRLIEDAEAILEPVKFDPANLHRQFTIQSNDDIAAALSAPLVAALGRVSAGASVRFALEGPGSADALREGRVDLAIGSGKPPFPEMISLRLNRQRTVGAARIGHPIFDAPITPASFAAADHVGRSRKERAWGPIDDALAAKSLARHIKLVVPSSRTALKAAAKTDLIATGADVLVQSAVRAGAAIRAFELPVPTPILVTSLSWHPQFDADGAHEWFRGLIIKYFSDAGPDDGTISPIE